VAHDDRGGHVTGIKICGLTRRDDALFALEAGADALGFVLAEGSPRRLTNAAAQSLVAEVRTAAPHPFLAVAVLGTYKGGDARAALTRHGFDRAQLVGKDDDAVGALARALAELGPLADCAWGSLRVRDAASLAGAGGLGGEALHLDAHMDGALGGTGQTFAWELAAPLARARRVVLAGGLTAANVGAAVRAIKPWRVDVSSGVEERPGIKDRQKMQAFVEAVRNASE
jgi:phosphoribosylanthranilate isomerase